MTNARYALATDKDSDAGLIWSTGGVWKAGVPEVDRLMTGPEADAFAARQPGAVIVDVVVYRDMCKVWGEAFSAALAGVERSTEEQRAAAREAGRKALILAGYAYAAGRRNPFNPCEV